MGLRVNLGTHTTDDGHVTFFDISVCESQLVPMSEHAMEGSGFGFEHSRVG